MAVDRPEFLIPDWPVSSNVRSLVTTRSGGCSKAGFASFNLGDHVGDDPQRVTANRQLLVAAAGLPVRPCWLNQVHGIHGVRASESAAAPAADWSWSDTPASVCVVMTADCLPLLICDEAGTRVAAVHAGWRGMCDGVIEQAVAGFRSAGIEPGELRVWLGPAIGPAAYEVDTVVYDAFSAGSRACLDAFTAVQEGHWMFDLYTAARLILAGLGVSHIYGGGFCTLTDPRFYSYRQQPDCGRQASLIWLAESSDMPG